MRDDELVAVPLARHRAGEPVQRLLGQGPATVAVLRAEVAEEAGQMAGRLRRQLLGRGDVRDEVAGRVRHPHVGTVQLGGDEPGDLRGPGQRAVVHRRERDVPQPSAEEFGLGAVCWR